MTVDPADEMELLAELCNQAVAIHGDDVRQIENYVEEAIGRLPADRRSALKKAVSRFLCNRPDLQLQERHISRVN